MDKSLIHKYRNKGVLIDTNLLLCLIAGLYSPAFISSYKDDFEIIKKFLNQFKKIVVTPHILTEVNSFLNQIGDPDKIGALEKFIEHLDVLDEEHEPARGISKNVSHKTFKTIGLTDSGIIHHAKGKYLVFTDDGRLTSFLNQNGIDYINFNHIKHYLN